jgi:hypothetical protein
VCSAPVLQGEKVADMASGGMTWQACALGPASQQQLLGRLMMRDGQPPCPSGALQQ